MRVRWPTWPFFIASWLCLSTPLNAAEVVEIEVAPGIFASANFHRGDDDKPVIILLHGWLQTREFSTVARLFDTLSGSGYTILTPNLSLGINRRAKSLPCESVHTNSIDDDIFEIDQWVIWLSERSQKPLILMGHSMGAAEVVAFMEQYREERVARTFLISIGPIGPGWPINNANDQDWIRAKNSVATNKAGVSEYGLAYCKKYVTTAHNLLSFYRWDYARMSAALSKIKIPSQIIIGSNDSLINTDLIQKLASERVDIDVLEGAGHFFDKEFEFDLHDAIEEHLTEGL